jgi:hypothetical protein
MNMTSLSAKQLREAADLKERIDALQDELTELLGGQAPAPAQVAIEAAPWPGNERRKRRKKISAQGRANISAAAKARWAARRGEAPSQTIAATETGRPKRKRSAAWSKALSEAMKARWARAKRAGRSRL